MNSGKVIILMGLVLIIVGLFITLLGKLPGDINFKKGNVTFYFPVMTSIVISIILSLILFIFSKFR